MSDRPPIDRGLDSVSDIFWRALRAWRPRRPVSLFLLVAMLVLLLFGVQFVYLRDDPKRFAIFLSLYFIFFFVVIGRATVDFFDIVREHVRERETIFRDTFTKDGFAQELGQRVAKGDRGSWPEV